jgi:hypothetical protein
LNAGVSHVGALSDRFGFIQARLHFKLTADGF